MSAGPPPRGQALLLDLDNTLIDRDAAFRSWIATLQERAPRLDAAAMIALDRGGHGARPALFRALGAALGLCAARVRRLFEDEIARHVTLKPDAAHLLDRFPGPKVLVTNGSSRVQRAKIQAAGLDRRVDAVLVSSERGLGKPHPAFFRDALALAGVAAEHALMVGDHPVLDVLGAQGVGVAARMVQTRWFEVPPGVVAIGSLAEVTW